jgi:uncharacterized membrane protein
VVDGFVKKLRRQVLCLLLFVFYSSLLFVMRVVVCSFVRDIQKVTTALILVMLVLAFLELTTMVNLESAVVEFSPLSHRCLCLAIPSVSSGHSLIFPLAISWTLGITQDSKA